MIKSNLIELLVSLSNEELKEFDSFVRSPFYNKNKSVIKLFDYLKKLHPGFNGKKLDKKQVYGVIFGKAEYNDGFMRVLISNLSSVLKKYLTLINLKREPALEKLLLLKEINLKKLAKEFSAVKKETENIIKEIPDSNMWYYHFMALLEDNIHYFNQWNRQIKKKNKLPPDKSLKNIIDNFTRFYLIASLTMYRVVLHINNYGKLDVNLGFVEDILKVLESRSAEFTDTPVINVYLNEIMLMITRESHYYKELKQIFMNDTDKFTHGENYSLLNILNRFITVESLRGNFRYEKDKLSFFKSAISKKFFLHPFQKLFEENNYISIVNSALEAGEINWAEAIIKEYSTFLRKEVRETVNSLMQAKINFSKGQLDIAQTMLNNIKTNKLEISILTKISLLKIYFEKSLFIESDLIVDSLRHLLPKTQSTYSPIVYESFKNFLRLYSVIIKSKEKMKPELAENVLSELKKKTVTQEHKWLKEKANELLK